VLRRVGTHHGDPENTENTENTERVTERRTTVHPTPALGSAEAAPEASLSASSAPLGFTPSVKSLARGVGDERAGDVAEGAGGRGAEARPRGERLHALLRRPGQAPRPRRLFTHTPTQLIALTRPGHCVLVDRVQGTSYGCLPSAEGRGGAPPGTALGCRGCGSKQSRSGKTAGTAACWCCGGRTDQRLLCTRPRPAANTHYAQTVSAIDKRAYGQNRRARLRIGEEPGSSPGRLAADRPAPSRHPRGALRDSDCSVHLVHFVHPFQEAQRGLQVEGVPEHLAKPANPPPSERP
jgi:hypothetical protein